MKRKFFTELVAKGNAILNAQKSSSKLLGVFVLLFCFGNVQAQVSSYTFSQSSGTYTAISGGTAHNTVQVDDDIYSFTLPFSFNYNGTNYTTARPTTNGFLVLGATAPPTTQYTPLSSGSTNFAISAFAHDVRSIVRSEVLGTAPNRIYVCQWSSIDRWASSAWQVDAANVQIRLYETTNVVQIIYGSNTGTATSSTVQVGLRGSANSDFNNRTSSTNWTSTTAGGSNVAAVTYSSTVKPSTGLTYTWTPSACSGVPTGLTSSSITTTTATISWTAPSSAPANGYEYYYSTSNTTPTASQTPSGSTGAGVTTANLSSLTAATPYYYWVRSKCNATDKSAWSVVGNFTTACVAPNAPSAVVTSNITSTTLTVGFSPASPVPSGYMVFMSTTTTTPPALVNGTTYTASTNYTIGGNVYRCVVSSGTATSYNLTGGIPNTQHNYFVFSANSTNSCNGAPWYSSGVSGYAITCPAVASSPTSSVTSNSATVSWSPPATGGTALPLKYRFELYTDAARTVSFGTPYPLADTTSPVNITGISASTTYYYRIIAYNSSCQSTNLDGSFTTLCDTISTLPWTENFDAMSTIGSGITPACWKNVTGTKAWVSANAATDSYNDPRSVPNYMSIAFSNTTASQLWTPFFALSSGVSYDISFYYNTGTGASNTGWTGKLLANTTQSLTGAAELATFVSSTQTTSGYVKYTYSYTPPSTNNYSFAISVSSTGNPWQLGVDDFRLETTPTCFIPVAPFSSSMIAVNNANINWTAPSSAPGMGYEYYLSTTNTAPTAGTTPTGFVGTTVTTANIITGLVAGNTYYWWVRSNCDGTDKSTWVSGGSFYYGYCLPSSSNATNYISNFSTTKGYTSNIAHTSTYTTGGYQDNYATQKVEMYPTGAIDFSFSSPGGSAGTAIWVDWNNNLVFESSERVYSSGAGLPSYVGSGSGTITVPTGTALGDYRMRIRTMNSYYGDDVSPCANGTTRSEAEDYKFTVVAQPNYLVYTDATVANATVNHTINVYLKDFDPVNNFYTDGRTQIWMHAGVKNTTGGDWQYVNPSQDFANTSTLVLFTRESTNPNVYKATIKFADYFCIPTGTMVEGINMVFRNEYWSASDFGGENNNKTQLPLVLDLTDATVTITAPTLTATTAITTTTATINWTAPATGAVKGYDYYYSTSNTAPTAGTTPSGSTLSGVTTANLTLLSATTTYYVWVRTKGCGSSVSAWSTIGSFTTSCGAITAFPFTETFEDASATRNCWTNEFVINNISWIYTAGGGGTLLTSAYAGTKNASFYHPVDADAITKLVSPVMDISSLSDPGVSFYYGQESWSGDVNEIKVYYRTSSTNPWIELKHYFSAVSSWTYDFISLPNPSSTYQIAFEGINNYGRGAILDNVTIESLAPITYTWNGSSSTSWDTATNWTPNGIPGSKDHIIVTGTSVPNKLNIVSNKTVTNFELTGSDATSFSLTATNSLTIKGTVAYTGTATAVLNCNSTVNITSTSNQIILPLTYGNLNALGGNRTFSPTGTIKICSAFSVDQSVHSYTITDSTVEYISSATGWTMSPFTYNNLTFSGTGSFTLGAGNTINVLGNYQQTTGTFILTNSSTSTNTINIAKNMTLSGGTFNMNNTGGGTGIINLGGNLTVETAGTLSATASLAQANFNFTGNTNQIISGAGTINIYRSNINKSSGYVDLQRNLEIKRRLFMTSGNIVTNINTLTLGESASNSGTLTYTSGFVVGKMTRWFATGATSGNDGLFPLGTSTNENRFATINYANVTTPGRLTAEVVETAMGAFTPVTVAAAGSCPLFEAKTGDTFYWKLTNNAIVATNYTAAFRKQTATAAPLCSLALLNRNPTTWLGTGTHIASSGTTTDYTVSRSGLTAYGDFGIGIKGLCGTTKTWASGAWTGGDGFAPTATDAVIFAGNYNTQTTPALPNVSSCECTINPGATVTIDGGKTLTVEYGLKLSDNSTPDPLDDGKLVILNNGSLVQVADVNNANANNNIGKISMERITKPMYRYDFTYWSSPVFANNDSSDDATAVLAGTEFNLKALSPMTFFDKYYKWENSPTTSGWATIPVGVESMVPGRGYIVRAPQNYGATPVPASYQTYTANFIGVPNNGIVQHAVSGPDKWNLLGNPYPSAIHADAFFDANVGAGLGSTNTLEGTIYLWTHNTKITETGTPQIYSYSAGDYACYNGTGSTDTKEAATDPTPGNPNDNKPTGYIAAGQSFFIKGTAVGQALFNNTMRVAGNNGQFFRPASTEPVSNWDTTGKHRIWLNMKGQTVGFNQLLVGYIENATNEWDIRFDGESFGGNQVTFYSILADKNLTIQGRALPFNNQDEVPLGYKTTLNGTLTISIDDYDGLFEGQDIYLEDKLLNIVHDLKASAYNFTTVSGTFNGRFVLRYLPSEQLGNPDPVAVADGLILYQEDDKIMIKSQLQALEQVTIYDLLGRTLFNTAGIGQNEIRIENVVMNEQPLIVKIRLANGQIVNKKIVY
ncbi:fibronectin type III domain-containing protein [Flavobacterium sp. PLA-1-15]|uniref:fibronectin type III domain-containing protein n=1 Tax=Flavobacterium sp. PLA-1-15 TaxID=3380533 RepID=UPI003B804E64